MPQGKTLTVNGTLNIANQSSLAGEGTLAGSGAFSLTNPEPVISGSDTLTYDGTDHFNDFSLTAPIGTVEVMGQNFNISNTPSLEGWSLETQVIKDAGNYTLTAKNSDGTRTIEKEVTVEPTEISITSATVQDKTYDGTIAATVESVEFTGLVNNESLSINTDYTATAIFDDWNAGDSKQATVTVTLKNGNYSFVGNQNTHTVAATGTISPLPVELVWYTPTSFTYDGTQKSVAARLLVMEGDSCKLVYAGNTATNAGNYTARVTDLSVYPAENYILDGVKNTSLEWSITSACRLSP